MPTPENKKDYNTVAEGLFAKARSGGMPGIAELNDYIYKLEDYAEGDENETIAQEFPDWSREEIKELVDTINKKMEG